MKLKIIVFVSILLSIKCFSQTNLFVAVNGSDITGTGTISNPYKTIEKGALQAEVFIASNPTTAVNVLVRAGLFRNPGFTTFSPLSVSAYDPQNIGEPIWKNSVTNDSAVRLNNIDGNPNAWITIKPYNNESVVFEGDADVTFNIRNCSYLKIQGFEIKGIVDKIPLDLSWKYWGTYRYDNAGTWIYGDRKLDICATYSLSNCSQIPPIALTTDYNYVGLSDISSLNVQRPNIFGGKGILVNLSNHIEISDCTIHHFPGGGLRVTGSDYINILRNKVHHNSSRASVGTHGLVIEGLDPDSGNNSATVKCLISGNTVYSNYNEIYSWVETKTICTTVIDEGKGIALLRTGSFNGFNGIIRVENNITYDNGKSGIHANDVDDAIIINNTAFMNGHTDLFNYDLSGGTNVGISIQSCDNIKITNNISVVPNGITPPLKALSEGQNCTNYVVTNNLIFGGGTSDFAGGYSVANPLFVNEDSLNFNLQATSPTINTGTTNLAPTNDFAGLARVGLPDIGAYEFNPNLGTNNFETKNVVLFPNPVNAILNIKGIPEFKGIHPRLFDIIGDEIPISGYLNSNNTISIDVNNLIKGVYFIKYINNIFKFIKE